MPQSDFTGKQIRDESLTGADVQDGTIAELDLAVAVRTKLNAVASGDMLKSVYDANNDGRIDTAALGTGTPAITNALRGDSSYGALPFKNFDTGTDQLRKWRNALSDLDSGAAATYSVLFIGDSNMDGTNLLGSLANIRDNSMVGLLRSMLNARYEDLGLGFVPANWGHDFKPWTYNANGGAWAGSNYGVAGQGQYTATTGATAALSFDGTGIIVSVLRGTGTGNIEISVDGVVQATVDLYSAALVGNYKLTYTGFTAGPHTLSIKNIGLSTSQGATVNALYLNGAEPIKGTRGVKVHNFGCYGIQVYDFQASPERMQAGIDQIAPVLTVIGLISNDYNAQTVLATYISQVQVLITRALQFGDVLLTGLGMRTETRTIPQSTYNEALRTLAQTNGIPFLDVYGRWRDPAYAYNVLSLFSDGIHPNLKGHADIASGLGEALVEPGALNRNLNGSGLVVLSRTANFVASVQAARTIYACNAAGGSFSAFLPSAKQLSSQNRVITLKQTDNSISNVTAIPQSGETIDGLTSVPLNRGSYDFISDGSNWMVF